MRVVRLFRSHLCFPGGFTRPTGDLGLQLSRRIDHVETRSPPYVSPPILAAKCLLRGPEAAHQQRRQILREPASLLFRDRVEHVQLLEHVPERTEALRELERLA